MHRAVNVGGIPHLAKNERDVGTGLLVRGGQAVVLELKDERAEARSLAQSNTTVLLP